MWKEGRVGRRGEGGGNTQPEFSFFFKEESTWKLSYSLLLILNSNIKTTFWKEFLLISSSLIKWKKRVITTTELLYESPFLKKNLACLRFFCFLIFTRFHFTGFDKNVSYKKYIMTIQIKCSLRIWFSLSKTRN